MRKNKKFIIIYLFSLPVFSLLLPILIDIIGRLVTTDAVVNLYLSNFTKMSTIIVLIVWQLVGCILVFLYTSNYSLTFKSNFIKKYNLNKYESKVIELTILINICMIIIFCFYPIDVVFQRISRNVLTLDSIAFSVMWKYAQKNEKYGQIAIWILYLIVTACAFYPLKNIEWINIHRMALENNIFWK
ncbi:hypothetical protein C8E03_1101 [Lachnotalea glycerini]|uniref:Uncharacterized protein n=2 Tax=Lachnotalea glycerini TaxID=1763509 RepID=A0A318EPD3_9FIRM|nr:hypothetical protein C8E03_1101 [Lachnotalea glycerini]